MKAIWQFRSIRILGLLLACIVPGSYAKTLQVQCGMPGQTIEKALTQADPGDTIYIQGTCTGPIIITTDYITIDGGGTAVIQGAGLAFTLFDPLIGVSGAQGVAIQSLRVENAAGEGIAAQNGAAISLTNVTLRGSTIGLAVSANSTAELAGCTIENNFIGVDLFTGSSLVLKGKVVASNNMRNGMDVTGNSTVEIRGAQLEANNNGGQGITLDQSQLVLLGFPPSQGSSISASGNKGSGILVGQSSVSLFGDPGANSITASNNAVFGIRVLLGGRILSPQGAARFGIAGNQTGLGFESDASALIAGGLDVRNNQTGVLADGAGVLTFVPVPQVPSSIINNTIRDFDARFGSRIKTSGVSLGVVACDATVLSQGLCP
jgi:hypothetical protein